MSLRNHAVIVEPQRWERPVLELARLLVPVTGAEAGALARVLERGPMTVEADLSEEDASTLARRLRAMGIPAVSRAATRDEVTPENPDAGMSDDALPRMPGARAAEDVEAPPAAGHRPRRIHQTAPLTAASDTSGGWGELFPDLADGADEARHPPSLDELESAPIVERAAAPIRDDEAPGATSRDDAEPPRSLPSRETAATPAGMPVPRDSTSAPSPPAEASAQFDGGSLIAELVSDEERPPYAPTGFDPRPEHLSGAAALLSAVAPGAGQVFNGDGERALSYGLRFWWIKPWIESVRDAYEKGERIRTYRAPRPEPGAFVSALEYAAGWWISTALVVTLLVWLAPLVWDAIARAPVEEEIPDVAGALADARSVTLEARVDALEAVRVAAEEVESRPRYTMPDEERAQRLFVLGYIECKANNFSMCEQMMKRVAELSPGNARAIKLQAWASVRQRGDRETPIPDVGDVPTLSDWELQRFRDDMVQQGEEIPPPRDPEPPTVSP